MPNMSVGVFSQSLFRGVGAGPLDDCWCCADLMCVHGCAPWEPIRSVPQYRAAAGVPDTDAGHEGGDPDASLRAIRALYPRIGAMVELYRGTWAGFEAQAKASQRIVSASVWSRALGYQTDFRHRVAVAHDGAYWRVLDPLRPAFELPSKQSDAWLRAAFLAYPEAPEVTALIFPTDAQAFATHPLYVSPGDAQAQGYQQAKHAAIEAVSGI